MTITEKINRLYDYAAEHPDGFTYIDVANDIGWRRVEFFKVVNRLRALFGSSKDITLACVPDGSGKPWVYTLVGTVNDDVKWWQDNRLDDADTRLTTIRDVAKALVSATDGRTVQGRRARLIDRSLTRLLEDLADLNGQLM